MVATLLLSLTMGVVGFFALMMWADARDAAAPGPAAGSEGASTATGGAEHANHNVALPLESFAGVVPANAAELAEAHPVYDATLPPLVAGDVVQGAHGDEAEDGRDRTRCPLRRLGVRREADRAGARRPRP